MENAQVVIIEDEDNIRELTRLILNHHGHEVVAEASTLDQALAVVEDMRQGTVSADVVLLDGNLEKGDISGNDARRIMAAITAAKLTRLHVLGYSSFSLPRDYGITGVHDTYKAQQAVFDMIDELPRL